MTRASSLPLLILFAALLAASQTHGRPAGHVVPAGERLTTRGGKGGPAILPNGRLVTPLGRQVTVPPHPYGLALSADGRVLAASSNGTRPFALTVLTLSGGSGPGSFSLTEAEVPELKSLYQGVALSPDGRTLYASGGEDGRVHFFDVAARRLTGSLSLDGEGFQDSLTARMALAPDGRNLLVLDQANYRLAVVDTDRRQVLASARTGRTPFAVTFSPDGRTAYVANIGLFEYRPVERAAGRDERGLPFPPFGYPSKEAREGTVVDGRRVPGLGPVNTPESYSVWAFDLADPARPRVRFRTSTGVPIAYGAGAEAEEEEDEEEIRGAVGGSAPCALAASDRGVYVSNANNDSIQEIDARTGRVTGTLSLGGFLPAGLRRYRGLSPYGLALSPSGDRLYAALAGFNAVAVLDPARKRRLGLLPAGWYPAGVLVSPDGRRLYVANAKGRGAGPNGGREFRPGPEGTGIGALMQGTLSLVELPPDRELPVLTRQVLSNNGAERAPGGPARLPPVRHVLFITKENRTFDEVFGALPGVRGDASLARFGEPREVEGVPGGPVVAMPNHLALARRYAVSDNFYVDSDHSADGHRWLAGVAPNPWTESVVSAAYGGQLSYRGSSSAPGRRALFGSNSSVMPEDYLEAGTLWHHLARHRVSFRNWGEGFEFAGVDEGPGLKPTGARLPQNIPMPAPLFRNTSRDYPGYNTNIPDQYRADVFLREFEERYASGREPLPRYLYIHLPNDHGARPRPEDGYPSGASFMADNDVALGRIIERLSRSSFWRHMAVFITEDDAQGGVDSVDAHRSVLMVVSPWVKRGYVSRRHADISAIHHAVFDLFRLPPLSLYDALASDLSDFWTRRPDFSPYTALPVEARLFDPARARDPKDPEYRAARKRPSPPLDDPGEVRRLRRAEGLER